MCPDLCEGGVQLGSSAGVTVVLDCGGADADMNPELLKHLTIISPNESELANLTGKGNLRIQTYALLVSLVIKPVLFFVLAHVICCFRLLLPWALAIVDC